MRALLADQFGEGVRRSSSTTSVGMMPVTSSEEPRPPAFWKMPMKYLPASASQPSCSSCGTSASFFLELVDRDRPALGLRQDHIVIAGMLGRLITMEYSIQGHPRLRRAGAERPCRRLCITMKLPTSLLLAPRRHHPSSGRPYTYALAALKPDKPGCLLRPRDVDLSIARLTASATPGSPLPMIAGAGPRIGRGDASIALVS